MTNKQIPPSNKAFVLAIGASLLVGIVLMFGSLRHAAVHMQVTM